MRKDDIGSVRRPLLRKLCYGFLFASGLVGGWLVVRDAEPRPEPVGADEQPSASRSSPGPGGAVGVPMGKRKLPTTLQQVALPGPSSTASPAEPYPGPDRRSDPIAWLSWKLDRKRELAMDRLLRACPEAKPVAGPVEDLYRQTYSRLVAIAAQGKAGELGPEEFRAEERRIADSFKVALRGQMASVVKSEPCYALLRGIEEERMSR